ncbi:gamma carbonic anhydrase family protein [Planctomycetota bacterium]
MALYEFEGYRPDIGEETYVSKTADVIGKVTIGKGCYIGPGARIKGDYGRIQIGDYCSVQENCILHARPDDECVVGNICRIGHGSILHNCTIKDDAIIGMGAIISDWATIHEEAIVAEGCVVKQYQEIPPRKIAAGVPAKVIGDLTEEAIAERDKHRFIYSELAKRYQASLKRIE